MDRERERDRFERTRARSPREGSPGYDNDRSLEVASPSRNASDSSFPSRFESSMSGLENRSQRIHPLYSSGSRARHDRIFATAGVPKSYQRRQNRLEDIDESVQSSQGFPSRFERRPEPGSIQRFDDPKSSYGYSPMVETTPPMAIEDQISSATLPADDQAFLEEWIESADTGELDIYTCLALSDVSTWSIDTQALVRNVIIVLVVQGVVPFIMLRTNMRRWSLDVEETELAFRMSSFVLYLYSIKKLYQGTMDECRAMVIERGFSHGIPLHLLLPAVFGELMNTIVGLSLVFVLFIVFTKTDNIAQLVMNSVAVNFLAEIDTDFVEIDHMKLAKSNMKDLFLRFNSHESRIRAMARVALTNSLKFLRVIGIAGSGTFCAITLLVTHSPSLCERFYPLMSPLGWCESE